MIKPKSTFEPLVGANMIAGVTRKFSTFLNDPIGSTKVRGFKEVQRFLCAQGERKLRHKGALDAIASFFTKRPPSAIPPNFADLWFLYQNVRQRKPRIVLAARGKSPQIIFSRLTCPSSRKVRAWPWVNGNEKIVRRRCGSPHKICREAPRILFTHG